MRLSTLSRIDMSKSPNIEQAGATEVQADSAQCLVFQTIFDRAGALISFIPLTPDEADQLAGELVASAAQVRRAAACVSLGDALPISEALH